MSYWGAAAGAPSGAPGAPSGAPGAPSGALGAPSGAPGAIPGAPRAPRAPSATPSAPPGSPGAPCAPPGALPGAPGAPGTPPGAPPGPAPGGPAPGPGPGPGGGGAGFGLSPILEGTISVADLARLIGLFSTLHSAPPQTTTNTVSPLPTDVAALQSRIDTLQAELRATTHLVASVARPQAEQATPTPIAPTTTTPTPIPCLHPDHPRTIASGRGAASPEVFKQMCKTNWHGRLGRAHMADVDALTPAALMELDSLVRRKLQSTFPHGEMHSYTIEPDHVFASLATLGLRLEDRPRYVGFTLVGGHTIVNESTDKRARQLTGYFYANKSLENSGYWHGALLETLLEIARYRGLFDDEGFLKEE